MRVANYLGCFRKTSKIYRRHQYFQFLQANATLENKIQAVREQQEESIRVAAYASIAMYWMPEILYRFRRLCPKVDVDLRMVDHALEPFELLQSGKTDVIFASRRQSE